MSPAWGTAPVSRPTPASARVRVNLRMLDKVGTMVRLLCTGGCCRNGIVGCRFGVHKWLLGSGVLWDESPPWRDETAPASLADRRHAPHTRWPLSVRAGPPQGA